MSTETSTESSKESKESETKSTRRAILASAAMVIPAAAAAAAAAATAAEPESAFQICPRATGGKNANRFPQVVVQDQFNRKAWFYEELIRDKIVLVNFTSVTGEKYYPILDNLVKVQEMLEERLGDDVFMYTVTTKPHEDTPATLKVLAEEHGANWQFLSGEPEGIREILASFNARGSLHALSWIGNEKAGRWMNKPSRLHPLFIAEAVARLSTGKNHKPFLVDMRQRRV